MNSFRGIKLPPLPLGMHRLLCATLGQVPPDMLDDAIQQAWMLYCDKGEVGLMDGMRKWKRAEVDGYHGAAKTHDAGRPTTGGFRPKTVRLEAYHDDKIKDKF